MTRYIVVLVLMLGELVAPGPVHAITLTPNGVFPEISYREPTLSSDGSPLTDLQKTTIYWRVDSAPEASIAVPATQAAGGGSIRHVTTLVPILPCKAGTIHVATSATDAAGNESTRSATVSLAVDRSAEPCPPPLPPPSVATLGAVADTHVMATTPTGTFGSSVQVLADGDPLTIAYLKFDLSAFAGRPVTSAVLRLTSKNPSNAPFALKSVADTTWDEATLTYATRPPTGPAVLTFTPGTAATVDLTLTSVASGAVGSALALAIEPASGVDGFAFASSEVTPGGPTLTITFGGPPPTGDTTPPAVAITSPSAGAVVSGITPVAITATDAGGIQRVELSVDGTLRGTANTPPFVVQWDTTNGGTHACLGRHTHEVTARAIDTAGNAASATVTVAMDNPAYCPGVPLPPPLAPSGVTATATTFATVALTWIDNAGDEDGYIVERCTGAGCTSFATVATVPANTTAHTDAGLTGATIYRYRVTAHNDNGDSASSVVSVTTPVDPRPAPVVAPIVTRRCTLTIRGTPPDATGGWTMQARNGATLVGSPRAAPPYTRTVTLPLGSLYSITIVWTKPGHPALTSPPTSGTCAD